ncbi:MAG: tryptophanase [Sandaracinaceae bacterium]|nr:tryptophanase [Sandaracinaceae bacterium]
MSFEPKTIIEPFKVKVVEPLPLRTRAEREVCLRHAGYNLFALHAEDVTIDLMTDSGTSAMSQDQWAAMMRGDESYAGARSFFELEREVRELTGMEHVIPTHQGRAAERILFGALAQPGGRVPSNTHFDTTRANAEAAGLMAIDLIVAEGLDPQNDAPFKGNVDLDKLEALLREHARDVPVVVITVTNNGAGAQPVSLENLRGVRTLADRYGVRFFLDAARFAENAYLIKQREPGQRSRSARDIAKEMFSLADGCLVSAKKDGLVNIGGFLAMRDPDLARECRNALVLTEGFPTYGGLAGRDLSALAVGLREVLDERYLDYRIASVAYLWRALDAQGVPLLGPPGGHAVYLDARRFLPHVPQDHFPGQSVALALYLEAGVRTVEIGTLMFGRTRPDGTQQTHALELVRLAFPRRVYTQSHVDYVSEAVGYVHARRAELGGYRIVEEPRALRHFTAKLAPA